MIHRSGPQTVLSLLLAASCASCISRASEPPAEGPPAAARPPGAAAVRLEPSMQSGVRVERVMPRAVPRALRLTGRVQLDESHLARLLAPVAGQVLQLKVNVGDHVRRGEPLFLLNSRDAATAIEDHLDSHRDLALAEKTLAMTQDLYDHQAASKIALEQAQNDLAKARAKVQRTESALRAIGLDKDPEARSSPHVPVTSPLDGTVIERHVSDGQYVQPDPTPLMTIANLSTVWIEAEIFERDLHLVRLGELAEASTAAYPAELFSARVTRVSDIVDPASHTLKVRFRVANPGLRLKPEMFATVTLFVNDTEQVITVPAGAVLTEGGGAFVYVALDERTFARRAVEVSADGPSDERRILKGLNAGDRVVVAGAVLLRGHEDRAAG